MAKDVGDAIGAAIGHAAREVVESVTANAKKGSKKAQMPQMSGGKGMAAGAGLVALVPLAAKGGKMVLHGLRNGASPLQAASDKVSGTVSDAVSKKVDEAGGAGGIAKQAAKGILPFGGGDDDDEDGKKGGGSGGPKRRMPIQQAVDVAAPISEVYEKWTEYEEWPKFMHRLDRVSQEDDTNISFKTKIWGISREFKAEIVDEQEGERIKWRVTQGVSHTGVVTFHELGPRLTRVDVDIDVTPGSMIEKLGRGLRHAKRAVRADLHRFKAHVEIDEDVEEQDEEQQDEEQMEEQQDQQGEQDEQEEQEEQEEKPRRRASRSTGGSSRSSSGSSRGRSAAASSGSSSRSRSTGGSSRSSGSGSKSGASKSGASKSTSSRSTGGSKSSGGSTKSSGGSSRSSSSKSSGGSSRSSSSRSSGGSNGASASRSPSSRSRSSSSNGSGSSRSSSGGSRRRTASKSS